MATQADAIGTTTSDSWALRSAKCKENVGVNIAIVIKKKEQK